MCVCTYTHTHNGILLSHKNNEVLLNFYPKDPQGSRGHCGGTSNPIPGIRKDFPENLTLDLRLKSLS